MTFEINHGPEGFSLAARDKLPEPFAAYLSDYLRRVSRYKIIGYPGAAPLLSLYQPPLTTAVGKRTMEMRLARRFRSERLPATATIAVNKACQCECAHCSAVFYNHSPKRPLSTPDLKEAMRQTVELGATHLILLGGEPLLNKDLPDLIRSVDSEKAVVTLFTNGEFLTLDRCRELRKAGLLGAFVSIDSPDPQIHDGLRRRQGLFEKAVAGIRNLKRASLIAAVSSYLSHQNLAEDHLERMMEFGKSAGADEVTFFDAIPTGRWLHDTSGCLKATDRIKIRSLVDAYRKKNNYPGLAVQSLMTSEQGCAFCFAANTQFYLTAFGEMCPCDFTPLTIGSFPNESIAALWKKMVHTSPYDRRAKSCRMQDPEFRKKYIEPISPQGGYPSPLA
ncbi:MAG: radical SAM protein [Deltaproteobacteria bacterium]|nr:radical SAM protein [Deltaproteobacteria bacterium]